VDWAYFIRELVDQHSPHVEKIRLVMDNLNTHTQASLIGKYLSSLRKLDHVIAPKEGFETQL
jgi:hypothetical protein